MQHVHRCALGGHQQSKARMQTSFFYLTCKAVARMVVGWPTIRADLARCVHRLCPWFAKSELSEAFTRVVTRLVQSLARPACVALARGRLAIGAQLLAPRLGRELGGRVTESNRSEAHARLVLWWPARWACMRVCKHKCRQVNRMVSHRKRVGSTRK